MIQIAHNAVNATLIGAPKEALLEVHRLLSYRVAGSEHMPSFGSSNWDGRSSFFNYEKATFPTGFVRLISQGLKKLGHDIQIVSKPLPAPLGPERPAVDAFGYVERYDYQAAAMDAVVRHGNVIVQVATGGGKSRICRMVYKRINRKTLFLTTRAILMHQMKGAVEDMGEEVAVLGDGDWGIPYKKADGTKGRRITQFVVGMVQTLAQRLEVITVEGSMLALQARRQKERAKALEELRSKLRAEKMPFPDIGDAVNKLNASIALGWPDAEVDRKKFEVKVEKHERLRLATIEILAKFELVVVEEAHEVSGNGFYDVMCACTGANYRMALTATPFMKDDEEANMKLLATCGPVAIKISEELLISRGILATPYFKILKLSEAHRPKELYRTTSYARAYDLGIVNHEYRNKLVIAEVLRARQYGLNVLVLVNHTAHGRLLEEMMTSARLKAEFVSGESSQKVRQDALRRLSSGELDVVIGSTIFDVGVDVPSLGMVVLAGGGKAEVAMRQRIGRCLREKKSGPNVSFIIDIYDELNNHLKGHSAERQEVIKTTPGFSTNIVRDFDYVGLGLTKLAA